MKHYGYTKMMNTLRRNLVNKERREPERSISLQTGDGTDADTIIYIYSFKVSFHKLLVRRFVKIGILLLCQHNIPCLYF